jgi:protein SCO1/2
MNWKKSTRVLGILTAASIALATGLWFGDWVSQRDQRTLAALQGQLSVATLLPGEGRPLPDIELRDQRDQLFTRDSLRGKWSLMFFGYTHCPDVCPTTLATLKQAKALLKANGSADDLQVVFVSVDPARDTLEALGTYVGYFDEDFVGVTGTAEEINKLSRSLGIVYRKVANPNSEQNYLVDHSASIVLINPGASEQAVFSAPHLADRLAADFQTVTQSVESVN